MGGGGKITSLTPPRLGLKIVVARETVRVKWSNIFETFLILEEEDLESILGFMTIYSATASTKINIKDAIKDSVLNRFGLKGIH